MPCVIWHPVSSHISSSFSCRFMYSRLPRRVSCYIWKLLILHVFSCWKDWSSWPEGWSSSRWCSACFLTVLSPVLQEVPSGSAQLLAVSWPHCCSLFGCSILSHAKIAWWPQVVTAWRGSSFSPVLLCLHHELSGVHISSWVVLWLWRAFMEQVLYSFRLRCRFSEFAFGAFVASILSST